MKFWAVYVEYVSLTHGSKRLKNTQGKDAKKEEGEEEKVEEKRSTN